MKVYHYNTLSGAVEVRSVLRLTRDTIVVETGVSGQMIKRAELDAGGQFYTSPERAIEAFIVKAEAALANRKRYGTLARRSWREALAQARALLT